MELPPYIPELPADIDKLKGKLWGRRRHADDVVLERPLLIGYRDISCHRQAMYKTIENPRLGILGDRGFMLSYAGGISHEMSIIAFVKWSAGLPWTFFEGCDGSSWDQTK